MRLACLVALAAMPALGCAQGLEVSGRVVDARTGAPLPRASVSLEPLTEAGAPGPSGEGMETTTGADGNFQFWELPAGRYRLSGSCRGHLTAAYQEHDGFFAAMIVGAGVPGTTGLRLRLEPSSSIAGTVRDSSGDPVETASVSLFAPGSDGSGKVVARQTRFLANGSPRFEFDNLAPGTYFLAVTARPWFAEPAQEGMQSPLDVAYPLTFYDGADSSASAQPVALKAGESAEISLSLHAVPAVHVSAPMQGDVLQFPALSQTAFGDSLPVNVGMWGNRGIVGANGRPPMTLSIAPGSYTLQRGETATPLDVHGDMVLGGEQTPPAPVALSGKLAMADGRPLPNGLTLRLQPDAGGPMRFGGRTRRGGQGFGGFGQRPVEIAVAPDGSFHTEAAPPGEYRLAISGSGSDAWAVTGVAASGGEVGEDLLLRIGGNSVLLAATVAPANGAVSGRVGGGESGVMVVVAPQTGSAAILGQEDESDSDGTWTVRGVAPGIYRVVAIRDGWDLGWKRPEVLARYLQSSVTVTVPAGGRVMVPEEIPVQAR